MKLPLQFLFQYGTPAIYIDSTGNSKACRIFMDIGWRDPIPGYDCHPAELITVVSISLEDVPVPKKSDQILIDDTMYTVLSIYSQDDAIAALHVRKS